MNWLEMDVAYYGVCVCVCGQRMTDSGQRAWAYAAMDSVCVCLCIVWLHSLSIPRTNLALIASSLLLFYSVFSRFFSFPFSMALAILRGGRWCVILLLVAKSFLLMPRLLDDGSETELLCACVRLCVCVSVRRTTKQDVINRRFTWFWTWAHAVYGRRTFISFHVCHMIGSQRDTQTYTYTRPHWFMLAGDGIFDVEKWIWSSIAWFALLNNSNWLPQTLNKIDVHRQCSMFRCSSNGHWTYVCCVLIAEGDTYLYIWAGEGGRWRLLLCEQKRYSKIKWAGSRSPSN